ncbi:TIGR02099 family protein [Salinivibrio sp. EAGSL]|uniref:YhdP family protein n=1 Tax=Salinivibrio sp. EAGSL TaxID=2738468 RepID=UPI00158C95C7|nr:YhdP family protein [Salinivibrio sp. EAGSL]NUY57289.1 TIGR02099 family protein [Salinivibrio sp. EAGSL]
MAWVRKSVSWLMTSVISMIVITALLIGGLRFLLPNVELLQAPLRQWVSEQTGFSAQLEGIAGQWRNLTPSLTLKNVSLATSDNGSALLTAQHIDLQLDVSATLMRWQPVFSHVTLDGLVLDTGQLPEKDTGTNVRARLEDLFLARLGQFSIPNAKVILVTPSLETEVLTLKDLFWRNQAGQHQVQARIGVKGTQLEAVRVKAAFTETHGVDTLTGDFYLASEAMDLAPWLTQTLTPSVTIDAARLDAQAWVRVERGQPRDALLSIDDLALKWHDSAEEAKTWAVKDSQVQLTAEGKRAWRVDTDGIWVKQNATTAPAISRLSWQGTNERWRLNAADLDIALLQPLLGLVSQSEQQHRIAAALAPAGQVESLALSKKPTTPLRYQATLTEVSAERWGYFPAFHGLNATLSGEGGRGQAQLELGAQSLPYGDFFQAPLPLEQGQLTLNWQPTSQGVSIWSEKAAVTSADVHGTGAFRLDIPKQGAPFLALYAHADVTDAGQTWRYLPTRALPESLTGYLSRAIQGGQAEGSEILWFGALDSFPYREHDGIFQAKVPLRNGAFSFDTAWPTLTELDATLLFDNAGLTIEGDHVRLNDAVSRQVQANIVDMTEADSRLELKASLSATGDAVHRYMLATPLVDTVGAALTHINVDGLVNAQLGLSIPIDGEQPHASGKVDFAGNQVRIQTPAMALDNVSGALAFDDDGITAQSMSAQWLGQAINLDLAGEAASAGYQLDVGIEADWDIVPLLNQLSLPLKPYLSGGARWQAGLDLTLHDTGFDYQLGIDVDTTPLQSTLPAPLHKPRWQKGQAHIEASGNREGLTGRVQLPNVNYQARINTQGATPEFVSSQWQVGDKQPTLLATRGHRFDLALARLDVDAWHAVWKHVRQAWPDRQHQYPGLPIPQRVNVKVDQLSAGKLAFHDLSVAARQKAKGWHVLVGSQELSGQANWPIEGRLAVDIDHWHINRQPSDQTQPTDAPLFQPVDPQATAADKALLAAIPPSRLTIDDLWLEGYRLGRVEAVVNKHDQQLTLSSLTVKSGNNHAAVNGHWRIDKQGRHQTALTLALGGESTSDLMGRFGVSGGIQDASFTTQAALNYAGLPWQADISSLNGEVSADIQDGYISGVGGAGKLLGLFSLDSILRKIQLDFSGVFDDGLAFDDITGRAVITNGVLVTDNIRMDGIAGDMVIKGIANLVENQVNADVRFTPDITSGIPVLSAFAVTPQTALYVLAVTTAISPVMDVFTQVRYQVTGSIGTPDIREVSRNQEALALPPEATERLREQAEKAKE